MGLIQELGYEAHEANGAQQLMQSIASSRAGSWVFSKTLHHLDRAMFKLTSGRTTVPELLAGLPTIMVTTTGARTGQRRPSPLVGIPLDGDLAIVGSNFGQQNTPGWVYNLLADPHCEVGNEQAVVAATARLADEATTERVFEAGAGIYEGYSKYRERADHREIRVFILESAA